MNNDWSLGVNAFIITICVIVIVIGISSLVDSIYKMFKTEVTAETERDYANHTKSILKEMQSSMVCFTGTDPTWLWLGASGYQISMQQQELADYVRNHEYKADVAEQKHKNRCRWCGNYKNYPGQCKSCGGL